MSGRSEFRQAAACGPASVGRKPDALASAVYRGSRNRQRLRPAIVNTHARKTPGAVRNIPTCRPPPDLLATNVRCPKTIMSNDVSTAIHNIIAFIHARVATRRSGCSQYSRCGMLITELVFVTQSLKDPTSRVPVEPGDVILTEQQSISGNSLFFGFRFQLLKSCHFFSSYSLLLCDSCALSNQQNQHDRDGSREEQQQEDPHEMPSFSRVS